MKKLLLLSLLFLSACASNPNKARPLDMTLEGREPAASDVAVGVHKGEMVVQKEVRASEAMRKIQNEVYELEALVYGGERYLDNNGLWGAVRDCNVRVSKITGELKPMSEDRNYVVPEEDYEFGMDSNRHLVGIQREYLRDRLARFQQYKQVLSRRQDEYRNRLDLCNLQATRQQVAGQ